MTNKILWETSLKNSNLLLNTLLFLLSFVYLSNFTTAKAQVFDSNLLFPQNLSSSFEKTAIQSADESARNWSDYSGAMVLNKNNTQIYSTYGYKTGFLSFSFDIKKINE